MPRPSFLKNEKAVLGALALLLTGAAILPWIVVSDDSSKRAALNEQAGSGQAGGRANHGVRSPRAFRGEREMNWIAKVDYVPYTGSIEVDLRHRDVPVDAQLKVLANFSAAGPHQQIGGRWLARQKNGVYRAGDVHLAPGKWTMGLTGYLRSKFAFRIEQVLNVK